MKLVAYDIGTGPRAGVINNDRVVDVSVLLGTRETLRDVRDLLELPDTPLDRLTHALTRVTNAPSVALSTARLHPPVLEPPTVREYFDYEGHAGSGRRRRGEVLPEAWFRIPVFYFQNTLCMKGTDEDVPYPDACGVFDYEIELGAVISRGGSDISEADGLSHIAGFMIFNDWSSRDLQRDEGKVGLGPAKGKDSATSIGPWVVTQDELSPYLRDGRLHVKCSITVNGDRWMEGDGGLMQHTWGQFVQRASKDSRIVPGDVFGSGTIGGGSIGEAIEKKTPKARFLQPGDVVEMTVEGIGTLRNKVVAPLHPDPSYPFRAPKEG